MRKYVNFEEHSFSLSPDGLTLATLKLDGVGIALMLAQHINLSMS